MPVSNALLALLALVDPSQPVLVLESGLKQEQRLAVYTRQALRRMTAKTRSSLKIVQLATTLQVRACASSVTMALSAMVLTNLLALLVPFAPKAPHHQLLAPTTKTASTGQTIVLLVKNCQVARASLVLKTRYALLDKKQPRQLPLATTPQSMSMSSSSAQVATIAPTLTTSRLASLSTVPLDTTRQKESLHARSV